MPGDMLNAQHIDELVKKAAEFGGGKIHCLVNNAGFTWDGVIHKVCSYIRPNPEIMNDGWLKASVR